jgi:hypothetical protein
MLKNLQTYIEKFVIKNDRTNKDIVALVVGAMVEDAAKEIRVNKITDAKAIYYKFKSARKIFIEYLDHYGVHTEGKMKYFDAIMIPIRNKFIDNP